MKKKKYAGRIHDGVKKIRFSEDLLWGINPVTEGLMQEPDRFMELIIDREKRGAKIQAIIDKGRSCGIKISFVNGLRLMGEGADKIRHQGVIGRISEANLVNFKDLLQTMSKRIVGGRRTCLVVCDSLQDPHNLGAVARSTLASGASGMIVTRERSAPLGGTAAKSSAGAISHLAICQVTNLVTALKELKKIGFWVFGTVKDDGARSIYETDLTVPVCLVVGGEGKGIRPLVKQECDLLISIPMSGTLDSLNSSVAAAVTLFEAMRQDLVARTSGK